ncbi:mug158 [Symbiodinium natans]|uniref:Mug158 protein n=1 Tax=Symbiodinium natans TaxID=878477 RepID=A0A812NCE5_9DINO|nr:mug158 [Symbiodinium natans]
MELAEVPEHEGPFFWKQDGPQGSMQFKLRTIFEEIDMVWSWPVDVNYQKARAFCALKSEQDGLAGSPEAYRLITEAERQLIRHPEARTENMASRAYDRAMHAGGEEYALSGRNAANANLTYASHNVWEWTEDHFNPLDGSKVHCTYDDFSTPCFDGRHHMIRSMRWKPPGSRHRVRSGWPLF